MPSHVSAEKMVRKIKVRTERNRARRSRIRTFCTKVDRAVASRDAASAWDALRVAESELMRGVTKGILHLNTAARKVRRLHARVRAAFAV